MLRGFESIFGDAKTVHIVVSEEAATYRPEMDWLAGQLNELETPNIQRSTFNVSTILPTATRFTVSLSCSIWPNVPNSKKIFELAAEKTHPPHAAAQAGVRGENAVRAVVESQPARLLAAGTR